jgi:hypothetical protein
MTVEILTFVEALCLTDTGKRIINKNIERHISDQLYVNLFDNFENVRKAKSKWNMTRLKPKRMGTYHGK